MNLPVPSPRCRELLARADHALQHGDARQAGEIAAALLSGEPEHPQIHFLAGRVAMAWRQLPKALEHLHRAASMAPRHPDYAVHFARALARAHRTGEALEVANIASALRPRDPLLLGLLGTVYGQCHAHERATAAFRQALALAPDDAANQFNMAVSLTFGGDIAQAEQALETCLALAPTHWPAYDIRSRLRRQTPAANHVDALQALADQHAADAGAQFHLHMALAKEYEDLGDYDQAFAHLVAGKSANQAARGYAIDRDEAIVEAMIQAFPAPMPPAPGCQSEEPIFIVGMPRTGTTLLERIVSSHPEVHSAGELENFGVALEQLAGTRSPVLLSPEVIARARGVDMEQLGDRYLASTRPATALKPRFIDKLPHNFLYLGFIAQALPNARLICLRRDPLDTCLSNFREPFSETSPFHGYAFDLLDTGRYYVLFDRLMAHWKRVLPGRILEIDYETLVDADAREALTRQLLAHTGLPWNDACLHPERNPAPSTTASSVQVRSAIHRNAVRRWKNYEAQLGPLRALLAAAGIAER